MRVPSLADSGGTGISSWRSTISALPPSLLIQPGFPHREGKPGFGGTSALGTAGGTGWLPAGSLPSCGRQKGARQSSAVGEG